MGYVLLISTTPEERRVALLERGELREFSVEKRYNRGLVGNLYKGKVVRVMPGLGAAFVEIGVGRPGFLRLTARTIADTGACNEDSEDIALEDASETASEPSTDWPQVGDDILVQVTRDPVGNKGARLTADVSLAGRYLVFLPRTPVFGVSRRIEDPKERERLAASVRDMLPKGSGVVVRTQSQGRPGDDLRSDLEFLIALWRRAEAYAADLEAPALVMEDLDLLLRTARDQITDECERVYVDTEADYDRLLQFVDSFMPHLVHLVQRHEGKDDLFEVFGIDHLLPSILDRMVWLKSGGSIVIDRTEALTAIDVNSGSCGSSEDPEETALKTNLEAAREIAHQVRLRNIGGLVVVDFIDMKDPESRRKVFEALTQAFAVDKAPLDFVDMSMLGLVELSRKRQKEDLYTSMTEPCPCCQGRGYIRSVDEVCSEIVRKLKRELTSNDVKAVKVLAHSRVIDNLVDNYSTSLADLETTTRKSIRLWRRDDYHMDSYSIRRER